MNIDATLIQSERALPFQLAEPDNEPLPEQTRLAIEIIGDFWKELDPKTGVLLAFGTLPPIDKELAAI